jgi:hypothetical protein
MPAITRNSVPVARGAVVDLVAAARRDLEDVEAALARSREGDWDCLIALVVLARAARTADDATFALLDAHALGRRLEANDKTMVHDTPRGYNEDEERRTR